MDFSRGIQEKWTTFKLEGGRLRGWFSTEGTVQKGLQKSDRDLKGEDEATQVRLIAFW